MHLYFIHVSLRFALGVKERIFQVLLSLPYHALASLGESRVWEKLGGLCKLHYITLKHCTVGNGTQLGDRSQNMLSKTCN